MKSLLRASVLVLAVLAFSLPTSPTVAVTGFYDTCEECVDTCISENPDQETRRKCVAFCYRAVEACNI